MSFASKLRARNVPRYSGANRPTIASDDFNKAPERCRERLIAATVRDTVVLRGDGQPVG
jgi:hypothetical protein